VLACARLPHEIGGYAAYLTEQPLGRVTRDRIALHGVREGIGDIVASGLVAGGLVVARALVDHLLGESDKRGRRGS
jgi:hypothetical protein